MFLRHLTGFRKISLKHGHISKGALEGSSGTNLREMGPRKKFGPAPKNVIVSLDPNKFAEKKQQCLHIGNLERFRPYISLHKEWSPVMAPFLYYNHQAYKKASVEGRYPPDTRAFLYYSMSPEKPRIAGELRLRVASSDDPASFESGSDLLLPNGQPWSRQLYTLSKYYYPFYEKLREDQLVPDDLDTALSTLPSKRDPSYRRILYTINDTFIVDFSRRDSVFFIITELAVEQLSFCRLFHDFRDLDEVRPYTGTALARFERLTLQEHEGTRTVVLRFLKIITPVKCVIPDYDGYICPPKEGELHRRSRKVKKMDQSVWGVNIDKPKGLMIPSLRLLWDT